MRSYVGEAREALAPWGFHEVVQSFENPYSDFTFSHGIGDLLMASIHNYLKVELLCEYEYSNGMPLFRGSPHSRRGALPRDGRQATPDGEQSWP
jgi:hypothetical protein